MYSSTTPAGGSLNLWFTRLSDVTREAELRIQTLMSESEHQRLAAIGNPRRRREYLLSRALMRHALTDHFGGNDAAWLFVEETAAPPAIRNLPSGAHVGLTHSRGYIAFAISGAPVGIDIESMETRRDISAIAESFMDCDEVAGLPAGKGALGYFYRLWCAKEACYKMLPAAGQSTTTLAGISYPGLLAGSGPGYLIEAQAARFSFAAVTGARPDSITCRHFLHPPDSLARAISRCSARRPGR